MENPLTERQTQIVELLSNGYKTPEICAKLYLGDSTVKSHILRSLERTATFNREHLVATAIREGWIE